jgi:hypothetical protein
MILDLQTFLSTAQAFTGGATISTNVYDCGVPSPKRDGEALCVACTVTVAAGAGSTHTMEILQSAASNMSSPDVIASMTILAAVLVAGYTFALVIPPGFPTKEFIAFRNTSTGGTTTITLNARVTPVSALEELRTFPKGYVITG